MITTANNEKKKLQITTPSDREIAMTRVFNAPRSMGVSWQIILSILGKLLGDKDPKRAKRAKRAMEAMLQMDKIDIKRLEEAAAGA